MSYQSNVLARNPVSYWRMGEFLASPSSELDGGAYTGLSADISSETTGQAGVSLKPDGTKMYVVGNSDRRLYQYTLGVAWAVDSAAYDSVSVDLSVDVAGWCEGLFFRSDGSRFYIVDIDSVTLHQYDLSTPWDISTATHAGSVSVATEADFPTGMALKDDGTKLYVLDVGSPSSVVYQYSLGTAWDVTSRSYDSASVSVTGGSQAIQFNGDGSRLYVLSWNADSVRQWDLSTPWDLSSATDSAKTLDVSGQMGSPAGMYFDAATGHMLICGDPGAVYQYLIGDHSVEDSGSAANDGAVDAGLTLVAGLGDAPKAIAFDGSGKITVPHDAAYSIATTGQLAVEFLLALGSHSATAQLQFGKGAGAAAGEKEWEILVQSGNTLWARAYDAAGDVVQWSEVPISPDSDYLVGINFTGTTENDDIEIVLNGIQQSVTTSNGSGVGPVAAGTSDLTIGGRADDLWVMQDSAMGGAVVYDINLSETAYAEDYLAAGGTLPVASAHGAAIPLRVASAHGAAIPLRVAAAHGVLVRERVAAAHGALFEMWAAVASAHGAAFDLREGTPLESAHGAAIPLRVASAHGAAATLLTPVASAHGALFDLRVTVASAHGAAFDLRNYNLVASAHGAAFSLLSAPRTSVQMDVSLTAGDRRLNVVSWRLVTDEGGYLYEGDIAVGPEAYGAVAVNDAVTLDLFGESYALVVESKSRDREGPPARRWVLGVRSPTVRLDFPRARPVTRTFGEAVLARDAVEALLGEPVADWALVNWPIPAFRLAYEDASPIAAAQQIVTAAGGVIETDPDGALRVRHLYPSSPKHRYAGVAPDRVVDDQSQIVRAGEAFEPRRLVDRLTIRDTLEGLFRDRLEFTAEEDDARAGTLRVYPSPWRTNLVVTHTSNASLQLTALGEVTREETEVVEFAAGTARLRYPVEALLAVSWLYVPLGGLSFEPYATELTAAIEDGYSLAEIRYRTRSIDYRLVSPTVDEAQILLEEVA